MDRCNSDERENTESKFVSGVGSSLQDTMGPDCWRAVRARFFLGSREIWSALVDADESDGEGEGLAGEGVIAV